MTRHKVVLIPFPFDDLSGVKVRPAVCLTDPLGQFRHVVPAFITSKPTAAALPTDLSLQPADPDFHLTGLRVPSTLQLHRLMTVTTSLIRRELGVLSPRLQQLADDRLKLLLALR